MYPSKVEVCGDVLARRLKNRPDRDSLIDRNIIPAHSAAPGIHDKVTLLERKKTGDYLQKKIRTRPSRQQLIQRHILTDVRVDPSLLESMGRLERQRITDSLNERLQARPGPIELINEGILPVDSDINNAYEEDSNDSGNNVGYCNSLSPQSTLDSPKVADLESGITTLNCTSPSPPLHDSFSEQYKNHFHNVSNDNINPNCLVRKTSVDSNFSYYGGGQTSISMSQKENEKLVRTINKKPKSQKTKVKKLKFHECRPPEMVTQDNQVNQQTADSEADERYKKLLEQQTLYLRLQVLWQNAMVNALQGNTESVEAVTEEMENAIKKEVITDPQLIQSLKGKKLDDLRVIDLRAQLKQRGLLVSGTKAKLIERLSAFEQGHTTPADFGFSAGNTLNENITQMPSIASNTKTEITPVSTVVQMTTYSTSSGQAYQVIQAVSQPSRNVYQVLPAHCIQTPQQIPQIQLNHVNIHPVVEVTEPHVMTIEDMNHASNMKQQKAAPAQLTHITQQIEQPAPTILIHSGPQLQKASLLQHDKPKLQQYSDYNQPNNISNSYQMSQFGKIDSSSCQSTSHYNQSKYIISPTKNDICQQLSGIKHDNDERKKVNINNQNQNFRSRSSSEPQNSLKRNKEIIMEMNKSSLPTDIMRNTNNRSTLSPPGFKPIQNKSPESRRDTYDDIMDIIGELSTPSPSNAGSPLMTTSSSPNFHMVPSNKVENPPPYNACAYTNSKPRNIDSSKCLSVSPQHKLFSSVPENINTIGNNPTSNGNFLSSPYGSLTPNSLNGSLGSNLSGSLSSLHANNHSNSYNNLNHSSSIGNLPNHFSNDGLVNHSSSTGSIPQQILSDGYQRLSSSPIMSSTSPYGRSPSQTSNYLKTEYRSVSPMDLHPDDNMSMDIDGFQSNQNNLGWLDLNMETNSPSNLQYQSISPKEIHRGNNYYSSNNSNSNMGEINPSMVHANSLYGNNIRTQNSIYGNSRVQEGCISLFDLEGPEY